MAVAGVAVAALVISAAAGGAAAFQAKKQADAQRDAQKDARAAQEDEARRQRFKLLEESRRRRAAAINSASIAGAADGGSTLGSIDSIISQTSQEIGSINVQETFNTRISNANDRAARAQSNSQLFGTISNIAGSVAGA